MIQISPFHPEIDAIWHAVASCGARSIAIVAADTGAGTPPIAGALARRAGLSMMADKPEGGRAAAAAGAKVIGAVLNDRDNPSLLAELDRETWRLSSIFPRQMADLRARLHRLPALKARI